MMRRRRGVFVFFVLGLAAVGCSDTAGGGSPGTDLGDLVAVDGTTDGTVPDTTAPDTDAASTCGDGRPACNQTCCGTGESCESGLCVASCVGTACPSTCSDSRPPCGAAEVCCVASQECVAGACAPLCQTPRCGPQQACCGAGEVCDGSVGACVSACLTQVFCGPQQACCGAGEVCFVDACVAPGNACTENYQCQSGNYCEPTLSQCLPIAALPGCTYVPTEDFDPQVEWEWTGSTTLPDYMQVMMAPVVANLTDDNGDGLIDTSDTPDVLFSTFGPGGYGFGYLRVVSGDDGHEHATFQARQVAGASSIAVGDIDGDNRPEIVAVGVNYLGLVVFEDDGTLKWETSAPNLGWGGATLVDLDQDGDVEILAGSHVFDHLGNELWTTASTGCGSSRNFVVAADTTRDGQKRPEVITGQCVLDGDGGLVTRFVLADGVTPGPDGFPAVANFDSDPQPEFVVVAPGQIYMYDHDGTLRWTLPGPGGNLGPPTIGNFIDDDPTPEVAVAGASNYVVIDDVDDGSGVPKGVIVFDKPTTDQSSNVTGSSIFDFEGDGVAEAVYNDECFIHVYDTRYPPSDPRSDKFKLSNSSGTTHEYPIIADVDNDGNAEIIAIRNDYAAGILTRCVASWPDFDPAGFGHGVRVFGDRKDNWVSTRRIWNQHAYWVTNITEDGKVPALMERNYDGLNNFRQNAQSGGMFFAPDLTLESLLLDTNACPETLTATVTVKNEGAQGVGTNLPVSFYIVEADGTRTLIGVAYTTAILLPGNSEVVELVWSVPADRRGETFEVIAVVDDPGDGGSVNNECVESNNELAASQPANCEGMN